MISIYFDCDIVHIIFKYLEIGRKYGLNPTKYEIIPVHQFEDKMKETR